MNDAELKELINTQPDTRPLQVGEVVRVMRRADVEDPEKSPSYTDEMDRYAGNIFTIKDVLYGTGWIKLSSAGYTWHPSWLERV